MISIKLFKVVAVVGNPTLCSSVAFQSGPKSHTFTVILAMFALSQDGVINHEKVYIKLYEIGSN